MRRIIRLLALFLITCSQMKGQDRDSVLASMNAVKLATDRYLYGVSTQTDKDMAIELANKALYGAVSSWIKEKGLFFFKGIDDLPVEAFKYYECEVYPGVYRILVSVDKEEIIRSDRELASKTIIVSDRQAEELIADIALTGTVEELQDVLLHSEYRDGVLFGHLELITPQEYIEKGWLAYYEPRSYRIIDIITPMDASGIRHSLKTEAEVTPLSLGLKPAIWIYFVR